MTKSLSSLAGLIILLALGGCASSSGTAANAIGEPNIAAAYLPLHGRVHLGIDAADGAAMVIAPGIAVTNAHNENLVNPKTVIGIRQDYDLLFFRTPRSAQPQTAAVLVGSAVTAYGQGADRDLRIAHGTVREIKTCPGCVQPAYFIFAGNAGPGFSGGPVVDGAGKLVGITFGYKDVKSQRLMYAYDMTRVQAELAAAQAAPRR